MKKIQVMMLMMLVAFMGLCVQSCGSDDDPETVQNYTLKVALQDTGNLDAASASDMAAILPNYSQTMRCTESQAKKALDLAMEENKTSIPVANENGEYVNYTLKFYIVDDSNKEVYSRLLIIKDGTWTVK
ncbi:MAG: hypothetical protein IKH01_15060 [Prevotella sp.]|nr:hypothetical protein [Prevotella sp.]